MTITVNPDRKRRPTLIATRGLPASGKSTAAIKWVDADPAWRARMNRDDLRSMAHGRYLGTPAQEAIVSGAQYAGIRTALANGTSVVVDDTNLPNAAINKLAEIAADMDADFEVWDFRDVDVEVCVARDALRDDLDRVGEDVIRDKHRKYILNGAGRHTVPPATRVVQRG